MELEPWVPERSISLLLKQLLKELVAAQRELSVWAQLLSRSPWRCLDRDDVVGVVCARVRDATHASADRE